jgi:ribosomal protein S12 methylthiotransferase accessory factor
MVSQTISPAAATAQSAAVISRFLVEKLRSRGWIGRSSVAPEVTLEIGLLGLPDAIPQAMAPASGLIYPVRLDRATAILGPAYRTGQGGPCPTCLERRWLMLRQPAEQRALAEANDLLRLARSPALTPFALAAMAELACADLAAATATRAGEAAEPHVYALDLVSQRVSRHSLVPDSLCPRCARPGADNPRRARVTLRPVAMAGPGSARARRVTDYDLRLERFVSPHQIAAATD